MRGAEHFTQKELGCDIKCQEKEREVGVERQAGADQGEPVLGATEGNRPSQGFHFNSSLHQLSGEWIPRLGQETTGRWDGSRNQTLRTQHRGERVDSYYLLFPGS